MNERCFWERNEPEPNTGCWLWLGARSEGYGNVLWDGRSQKAHRVAYFLALGPIPSGLDLDHKCRQPACVNPRHLEPVTASTNTRRGLLWQNGAKTHNAFKSHCPQGHAYGETGRRFAYTTKSGYPSILRRCMVCEAARSKRRAQQRALAAFAAEAPTS